MGTLVADQTTYAMKGKGTVTVIATACLDIVGLTTVLAQTLIYLMTVAKVSLNIVDVLSVIIYQYYLISTDY